MAKEKKSAKADRKRNSNSAAAYKNGHRRYLHKIRATKRHIKRNPNDMQAQRVLKGISSVLMIDYVRGSEKVRAAHEGAMQ